jgi:thiamine kinase-like enzyme
MEVKQIAEYFSTADTIAIESITAGHINQSYLVTAGQNKRFVLQKINQNVFKNPKGVIDNLIKINDQLNVSDYPYQVAKLRYTKNNKPFFFNNTGFWRAVEYIENTTNLLVCPSAEIAFRSAKAYGHFARSLSGLNQNEIQVVIPDFHDPQKRYEELESAIKVNDNNRVIEAGELIAQARKYKHIISEYKHAIKDLPIRLVHNDTKISNLLFNNNLSEVKAVIDLDTVMPGYLINDFGDMVRSFCNPAAEDEADLNKVIFNVDNYNSLSEGYLSVLNDFITPEEKAALNIGVKAIIYTQFIRFLSDYLNRDIYYAIDYENQNLARAKVQLHLLKQVIEG